MVRPSSKVWREKECYSVSEHDTQTATQGEGYFAQHEW